MQRTPVTLIERLAVLVVLVAVVAVAALGGMASYGPDGSVGGHAQLRADDKVPTDHPITGVVSD